MRQQELKNITDIESEKLLLAGIMNHGADALFDATRIVSEADFTEPYHKLVFSQLVKLINVDKIEKPDVNTVLQSVRLIDPTLISKNNLLQYLTDVSLIKMSKDKVVHYAKIVGRLGLLRELNSRLAASQQIINSSDGTTPIMDIMTEVESNIFDFNNKLLNNLNTTEKLASSIDEILENLKKNRSVAMGVPTGFPAFDSAIGGGIRAPGVTVIAARPKCLELDTSYIETNIGRLSLREVLEKKPTHLANGKKILDYYNNGVSDCYTIFGEYGESIMCTEDHMLMIFRPGAKCPIPFMVKDISEKLDMVLINGEPQSVIIRYNGKCEVGCIEVEGDLFECNGFISHNCGKTSLALNIALNVAQANIPVLYLDTEMSKDIMVTKGLACLGSVPIFRIESGEFDKDLAQKPRIEQAVEVFKQLPFDYHSVSGMSHQQILSVCRKWLHQTVGFDENGNMKRCLIILDYIKTMNLGELKQHQEYQYLGQYLTDVHNFCKEYNIGMLAFVQQNRDGVDRGDSLGVAGSDRIVWLCTALASLKIKMPEDEVSDPITNGNRKLYVSDCRFGPGLRPKEYINIKLDGEKCQLSEGPLSSASRQTEDNGDISI